MLSALEPSSELQFLFYFIFYSKMHTYCSLGSPHLGYIYTDNTFVDGGLWFLKKIKNSASLHQFALTDSKNPLTVLLP